MEYRRALLRVSGEIGQKDLEKLKFACRDAIPESQRERIHSPRDLFTALEEKGLLGSDNLDYISRQFINIGRPQLRSCFIAFGLCVPPPDQHQTSPTSNGDIISPNERFTNFLLTLSERLNTEEVDQLAFAWCKNYLHITPDHIHSAYQLFTLMNQRLAITSNNLDILYIELNEMGRQDLCRIVDEYYSVTHKLYGNSPPSVIPSPALSTPYDAFPGYLNKPFFPPEELYLASTPPVNVPLRPNNLQFSISPPQDSINDKHTVTNVTYSSNDTPPSSETNSLRKPSRDNIPSLNQQQYNWSDVFYHNNGSQRSLSTTSGSNDGTPHEGGLVRKEKELYNEQLSKEQLLLKQQPTESEIVNYPLEIQRLQDTLRQKNQEIQQIVDTSTLSLSNLKIECYPMNQNPHGYCIIFNNYTFFQVEEEYEQLTDRGGAEMDQKTLVSTFEFLRYKVESYENLTSEQMVDKMKEVSSRDHTAFDSFVCCILTHGEEGKIFGSDSLPVNIQDLTGLVKGTFCRTLVSKPKLFFVQACRGDREEKGISIEKDGNFSLPVEVDYLFGYATPTGKAAYRSRRHGSWFISELCDVFTKSAHAMGLSNMMKKVNSNVSDAYTKEGYKQCTEVVDRLRKEVKFLPTYSH